MPALYQPPDLNKSIVGGGGVFPANQKTSLDTPLYMADSNYLIRWVIVTYILLYISVVNSHATSAYECELLAATWHYLPSVRLDNARLMIRPRKRRLRCLRRATCKHSSCAFVTRSKLIAAFDLARIKQHHLAGNIGSCV